VERKKHEIWALCILTLTVLVLCSLLSYRQSDLTFFNASASEARPGNWVGTFGANLAWLLLFFLGAGAYALPVLGAWVSYSLLRGTTPLPYGRIQVLGMVLLVLSSVALAALHQEKMRLLGQEFLTGGQVGLLISRWLQREISVLGSHVLLTGLFLISLVLATPFSVKQTSRAIRSLAALVLAKLSAVPMPFFRSFGEPAGPKDKLKAGSSRPPAKPGRLTGNRRPRPGDDEPKALPEARQQLPEIQLNAASARYVLPALNIMDAYENENARPDPKVLEENARILEEKLQDFGVQGKVIGIAPGPVITMYEYAPAPGIKISRIVGLADDLSMALRAVSIRVVAPIPGKAAIGIEIPNAERATVSLRSVLESKTFLSSTGPLTIALGKDITGQPVVTNMAKMPHLLIAGATGTGKSVCINAILGSLLFRNTPEELRLLLIDPKRIELSSYEQIPHLLHPVVTEPKMATRALRWAVQEMELRYRLLADRNMRNIEAYNKALAREHHRQEPRPEEAVLNGEPLDHHHLPYIVIIIDELADLMMVASREVEEYITRLAQMARAAGIHLILATQRPSVDVLTGIIKANISTRISFQVSSKIDSRTILDSNGAEALLGSGDMLFLPPGTAKLQRIQGAFVSDQEVQRLTQFWRSQEPVEDPLGERVDFHERDGADDIDDDEMDERYDEAVQLVIESRQASISMIQRRLRVGYNRAARMIEIMEQQGIVGPSDGSRPREVLAPRRDG